MKHVISLIAVLIFASAALAQAQIDRKKNLSDSGLADTGPLLLGESSMH
jgi:hypothetical protein